MRLVLTGAASVFAIVLSLPVLILGLPFWLMAQSIRLAGRLTEPKLANAGSLVQFDGELGWRPAANVKAHYLVPNDDIYPLVTDAEGWPGTQSLDNSEIVVIGDSFAYGFGARQTQNFVRIASEIKIKALASLGYDMVQEVLLMRKYAPRISGKLVLWWIYLENDLADNMRPEFRGYRKPFVVRPQREKGWKIVTSHVRNERWRNSIGTQNMETFAHLCTPSPIADHHYSACRYLIAEGYAACQQHGASLVVMTIPNVNQLDASGHRRLCAFGIDPKVFNADYPDQRIGEICRELGVPFYPMKPRLCARDYKKFERFHWTPSGHRRAAEAIREIRQDWGAGRLRAPGRE